MFYNFMCICHAKKTTKNTVATVSRSRRRDVRTLTEEDLNRKEPEWNKRVELSWKGGVEKEEKNVVANHVNTAEDS